MLMSKGFTYKIKPLIINKSEQIHIVIKYCKNINVLK